MNRSGRRFGIAAAVAVMALLVISGVALAECGKVTVGEMAAPNENAFSSNFFSLAILRASSETDSGLEYTPYQIERRGGLEHIILTQLPCRRESSSAHAALSPAAAPSQPSLAPPPRSPALHQTTWLGSFVSLLQFCLCACAILVNHNNDVIDRGNHPMCRMMLQVAGIKGQSAEQMIEAARETWRGGSGAKDGQ